MSDVTACAFRVSMERSSDTVRTPSNGTTIGLLLVSIKQIAINSLTDWNQLHIRYIGGQDN